MIFHTESGSTYELDTTNKLARARHAANPSSSRRLTPDWRLYDRADVSLGNCALIVWTNATPPLTPGEAKIPATITSRVISIEE